MMIHDASVGLLGFNWNSTAGCDMLRLDLSPGFDRCKIGTSTERCLWSSHGWEPCPDCPAMSSFRRHEEWQRHIHLPYILLNNQKSKQKYTINIIQYLYLREWAVVLTSSHPYNYCSRFKGQQEAQLLHELCTAVLKVVPAWLWWMISTCRWRTGWRSRIALGPWSHARTFQYFSFIDLSLFIIFRTIIYHHVLSFIIIYHFIIFYLLDLINYIHLSIQFTVD